MLDIEDYDQTIKELNRKFSRLYNRFIALAMDYKYYINPSMSDNEIFKLRDNIIFRLQSAKFHFELLSNHNSNIENNIREIYERQDRIFNGGIELVEYKNLATKEIYSLFDSLIYHLCSNFDYLFRLINFIHGNTLLNQPKWNLFKSDKNLKNNIYCSREIIDALDVLDQKFVYPLIKHRSFLIHNEYAVGGVKLILDDFKIRFLTTNALKDHFPELKKEFEDKEISIGFSAKWLIEKTLETITEILFEVRDDIIRNKKDVKPSMFYMGSDNLKQSPSVVYWGNRNLV